jgi:hypothetical protein
VANKRGWYWRGGAYIAVHPASGAWEAGRRLGLDLTPLPPAPERARREALRAELERELAAPLVPIKNRE